jgi:hypothetical protein
MARRTKRSKTRVSPAKIAEIRREYTAAKREYHKIGNKAFEAPSRSPVKKAYSQIKREYRRLGNRLASLTGRKPRRK